MAKMYASVVQFIPLTIAEFQGAGHSQLEASPLALALEGLECLFLAPLGFLLFRGVWDYVAEVIEKDADQASACFLMRVKALILGLMAAIVGTDLLKRALSKSGLTYESAIAGCLLIAILAAYSFYVERHAAPHCGNALDEHHSRKAGRGIERA
jgi:hypothetical protein